MNEMPLVTVVIATKDRHDDLAATVRDLCRQDYPSLEMLVIDDGSASSVVQIVKYCWPEARVIRHEDSRGQSARRNEGFRLATGKYILQLDDDCSLVAADTIAMSVGYMEATPSCAGIKYFIWVGKEMPRELDTSHILSGNCLSYVGAAVFLRRAALEDTAGYRDFFVSYGEEEELCLQFLKRGWRISYRPELIAHHRYSSQNRNNSSAWGRALRNNIWSIMIHCPLLRLPLEIGWKVALGAWDAFRLQRWRRFVEALAQTLRGASEMLKLRDPLDPLSLRRYDAFRAYQVLPYSVFENPPIQKWADFKHWAKRWPNRNRDSSFYSKRKDIGCEEVPHART